MKATAMKATAMKPAATKATAPTGLSRGWKCHDCCCDGDYSCRCDHGFSEEITHRAILSFDLAPHDLRDQSYDQTKPWLNRVGSIVQRFNSGLQRLEKFAAPL